MPRIALSEQKRLAHLSAAAMRSRTNSTAALNDCIATRLPDKESGRALSDGVVTSSTGGRDMLDGGTRHTR
jgi:hypothetical protein